MSEIALVTGAFGYTGTYLRQRLLNAGHTVRTLTDHPPADTGHTVQVLPYTFGDESALTRAFEGVTTFYNTYWVRYAPGGTTYRQHRLAAAPLPRLRHSRRRAVPVASGYMWVTSPTCA